MRGQADEQAGRAQEEPGGREQAADRPGAEPRIRQQESGPSPPEAGLDIRLLLPALVSWAAVALALSWTTTAQVLTSVGLIACGVVSFRAGGQPRAGRQRRLRWEVRPRSGARRWGRSPPRRWAGAVALTFVAAGLCISAAAAQSAVRTTGLLPGLAAERAVATIEGTVTSDPRAVGGGGERVTSTVLVRVLVHDVVGRGQRSRASSPVLVFGDQRWAGLRWHERIRATGRFDTSETGDDVVAVFNPSGDPMSLGPPGPVAVAAEHVRSGMRDATSGLPHDARGLLPGLVIGDRSRTPPSLVTAMQETGMSHLDAVSGSNVSIILAAAMGLCRVAGIGRRWRPVVAVLLLCGFVVLARPEPSVLRAAVMGVIGLLGLSASRRRAGVPALSAAVVVLLCVDPWLARSYGFALSTLATLGLLLFARPWGRGLARLLPGRLRSLGAAIAIPIAAQAMCGPVVVLLQGSVTLIGVLANLLAAPLVAPATVLGVAVAAAALVWLPMAAAVAWVAALPTLGIAWIARGCADVPMGSMPWPDGPGGAFLLAGVTAGLLFVGPWLLAVTRRYPLAVVCLAVLTIAATSPTGSVGWPAPGWRIVACDVGQGDGLVLASGPGHAVVVDTGPDPAAIDGCLSRLGISVVDVVVLTHFHADHADGLPGVLRGRRVHQILTSPVSEPAFQAREVQGLAAAASVPVDVLYAGDGLQWGDVRARALWPARAIREGSIPNNASVVLDVDIGGLRVLLLGDVEAQAAHQVLLALRRDPAHQAPGGFDVIKVAHHGSRLQDPGLLAQVGAPLALISVGAGNTYGHPSRTTLDLVRRSGSEIFRTDQRGDIAVSRGDDGQVRVSTRSRQPSRAADGGARHGGSVRSAESRASQVRTAAQRRRRAPGPTGRS